MVLRTLLCSVTLIAIIAGSVRLFIQQATLSRLLDAPTKPNGLRNDASHARLLKSSLLNNGFRVCQDTSVRALGYGTIDSIIPSLYN